MPYQEAAEGFPPESPGLTKESRFCGIRNFVKSAEVWLTTSRLGRFFRLEGSGYAGETRKTTILREIRAGLTTFATMAYIISVNASLLSQTGGTCECDLQDRAACDTIQSYRDCKEEVRRELITATAVVAGMATLIFGILINLPVAIAPGMGLNAYFTFQVTIPFDTFTPSIFLSVSFRASVHLKERLLNLRRKVVGYNGNGPVPYRTALTAVFVEGFVFIFLALTGMRQWLVRLIPSTLKVATGVGIGFFLTETGLSYSSGIGAITSGSATPLSLGGCPEERLDPNYGTCTGGQMSSPKVELKLSQSSINLQIKASWLTRVSQMWAAILLGGILTSFLMAFRIKFSLIIGIALISIISWPRNTALTYFPHTEEGNSRFDFFKRIVAFQPLSRTLNQLDWSMARSSPSHFALALFTFLYVDIIDATATLYSMVRFCGVADPKKGGDFSRSTIAYCTDAAFISIGSLFGCSPVTAFVESSAGIAEGGRTGLTAGVTGLCFFVSVFFAPVFASIPPWATGCALIMVGCMMIRQVVHVNWRYIGDVLPSFVVMTFIPFSYSVAYGLIAGIFVYTVLNSLIAIVVYLSNGRCEPQDYGLKEYWTWKSQSAAPWYVRIVREYRKKRAANAASGGVQHDGEVDRAYANETADSIALEARAGCWGKAGSVTHSESPIAPTAEDVSSK